VSLQPVLGKLIGNLYKQIVIFQPYKGGRLNPGLKGSIAHPFTHRIEQALQKSFHNERPPNNKLKQRKTVNKKHAETISKT
jgi:hypothetical protein